MTEIPKGMYNQPKDQTGFTPRISRRQVMMEVDGKITSIARLEWVELLEQRLFEAERTIKEQHNIINKMTSRVDQLSRQISGLESRNRR